MKPFAKVVFSLLLGFLIGLSTGYVTLHQNVPVVNVDSQKRVLDLEFEMNQLRTQIDTVQNQTLNLKTENTNLQGDITVLQGENVRLQNEKNQLETPKIATRLGSRDCNWDYSSMRLYIQGEVWNVGTKTAQNCSLHVTLYQANNSVANDSYVQIGKLENGSWTDVSANIHYSGSALTNWTIIPEYDP